jgi:transaldolase / glucose-6-phosphate isomerase
MGNPIDDLHALGQSIWYDNISRKLLENGMLKTMIERGEIRGITSNPSIFQNAIAKSKEYDSALVTMAWAGYPSDQIYESLVVEDIQTAADLFLPLYQQTSGGDGYVSLEVSPRLANDSVATLEEALRLWKAVDRPNLMVKIPGTQEGLEAIRKAIATGISVNVTLIFSLERYRQVMEAYLSGLEERVRMHQSVEGIASVASFFVSRMDTKVDKLLEALVRQEGEDAEDARNLFGKAAIANARLAYQEFRQVFSSKRFLSLQEQGARVQRPLWASTSTKNPDYPDTMYVDSLIGPNSINTVPPQTLEAFKEYGHARLRIEEDLTEAKGIFNRLEALGISVDQVTAELENEGVKAFSEAFEALLFTLEKRRGDAQRELGSLLAGSVAKRVQDFQIQQVPKRLHAGDANLWTDDPVGQAEIKKRLGWLRLPESSRELVPTIERFAREVRQSGYTHAILLGMGGSSLAPEVLREVYGAPISGLELNILDSTDPAQVRATARLAPVEKSLYIVSSKSGGTAEVNAFLDYFWDRAKRKVGAQVGQHFVAITDPDTSLEKLAKERGFRKVFLADPMVGGRFSALTAFGLVPAALMGINLGQLLDKASWMARQCAEGVPAGRNLGMVLGAVLGEAALHGKDKLTLFTDKLLESFGAWLEQLIAESSGKMGKGIVPIDQEPFNLHTRYGKDRIFVYLRSDGSHDRMIEHLRKKGYPALNLEVAGKDDLAAEFYRWEVATAVACAILGVNAFDQPDVQDSKTRTVNKIQAFQRDRKFDEGRPAWEGEGVQLFGDAALQNASSLAEALETFMEQARENDYLAINAYLPRNQRTKTILNQLRSVLQADTGLSTTLGFGPRFLHSTGQLHKGGPAHGIFLQITADPDEDLPIPGEGMTFGTLERAQALGDLEALRIRGRRALRIHFKDSKRLDALIKTLR